MRRPHYFLLLTCCALTLACDRELSAPDSARALAAKGGQPGSGGAGSGGGGPNADEIPVIITFRDLATDNFRSDGRGPYEHGICNISAKLTDFDDAIMNLAFLNIKGPDREACGERRKTTLEFDDPLDGGVSGGSFLDDNTLDIGKVRNVTLDSGVVFRRAKVGIGLCVGEHYDGRGLRFNPDNYPGSSYLLAERIDDDTWEVRTQDPPNDLGWCDYDGRFYHLPFQLTIQKQ